MKRRRSPSPVEADRTSSQSKRPMLRSAVLLGAVASASCFAPAAHMPNAAAVQRRSVAVLMNAPVEEKKGFLGMFGKKEEVSGKVVPTGAKVRTTTQMSARDRTPTRPIERSSPRQCA